MRLEQLAEVAKQRAPRSVSMLLFGSTFATCLGWGVVSCSTQFFTPWHTNSFSVLMSMLSNATLVVGVGALTGFKYANFTVLPSVAKKYPTSSSLFSNDIFSIYTPIGLLFLSLTLIDDFVMYGVAPALLAYGLVWTNVYYRSSALQVPLWYSRQCTRFVMASILVTLLAGYSMVSREFQTIDSRQVMANIQRELDKDMVKHGKSYNKRAMEEAAKREAELKRLKDPFI